MGDMGHKGVAHPGEHAAIVSQNLGERVKMKLAGNGPRSQGIANTKYASLLVGMLFDGLGRRTWSGGRQQIIAIICGRLLLELVDGATDRKLFRGGSEGASAR